MNLHKSLSLLQGGRLGLSLLNIEEAKQGHNRESTEANRANIKGSVAAGDGLDLKQVGCNLVIGALTISNLSVIGVMCIGAYEVGGCGHVSFYGPSEALHCLV